MRDDTEYIGGVLDELEAVVYGASGVPMRKSRAVLDRADLRVLLDELREALPAELAEAREIRRECEAAVEETRQKARQIVDNARERAQAQAWNTELCRRTQHQALEVVERAERYARELLEGSEAYEGRVLEELEDRIYDSAVSVSESRRELSGTPVSSSAASGYGDKDVGGGWQADSA